MWNTRWTTCRRPRRTPKKHSSIKAKPDGWVLPRCHASKPLAFRSRLIGHSLLFLPFITSTSSRRSPPSRSDWCCLLIPPPFPTLIFTLSSKPRFITHIITRYLIIIARFSVWPCISVWSVYYNRCTIRAPPPPTTIYISPSILLHASEQTIY